MSESPHRYQSEMNHKYKLKTQIICQLQMFLAFFYLKLKILNLPNVCHDCSVILQEILYELRHKNTHSCRWQLETKTMQGFQTKSISSPKTSVTQPHAATRCLTLPHATTRHHKQQTKIGNWTQPRTQLTQLNWIVLYTINIFFSLAQESSLV